MNAVELEHPTGAILTAYGLGKLNEEEFAGIDRHLAECATCRRVLEGVPPDTLLMLLRSSATEPDSSADNGKMTDLHAASRSTATQIAPRQALVDHPRYRVGDLIGVGGMGAVYKAEHLLMQRPVAVKVLNHELIDNSATVDRFRREVRAAARLTHPNIVAAFDAEQAGDVHFLAMEYVEGVSLARRCAEYGPLPVAEACSYARQAALGLQHAHECGMVHRDIKPQNLMLTPGGQVKILDFGLARFVMESAPAGALLPTEGEPAQTSSQDSKAKPLTQIGVVMGTPDYIAPEQAQDSHQADIRADIYSLGCTLYDMLAGHAPFPDGNAAQKVKAHLHKTPPPLKTLRRDVPLELVRVIERMMAKDPAQRYQTPAEVAAALAPFASSGPPRHKKWPLLVAGLGFVAALALGAIIYVQTDRGTIVIETNDEKIAVMIEKAGGVKIVDQANKREYLLRPGAQDVPRGEYQIEVSETLAGLEFQTKKFELKRGKEVRLMAKFLARGEGGKEDVANLGKQGTGDEGPLYKGKPASFWLEQYKDANPAFRVEALQALGSIAQKTKDLIPVVANALKDTSEVGKVASNALVALGAGAIPAVLEAMKNERSPTALFHAANAMAKMGPDAKSAVPFLIEVLRMKNVRVGIEYNNSTTWLAAIKALSAIGPDARFGVPAMIDALGASVRSVDSLAVTGHGTGVVYVRFSDDIPPSIYRALKKIDPEFKDSPPSNSAPGKTLEEGKQAVLSGWQKAYDALKKKYPARTGGEEQASASDVDLKQELAKLEGSWSTTKKQVRWKTSSSGCTYVFSGNSVTIMEGEKNIIETMTFTIDPNRTPKTIDLMSPPRGGRKAGTRLGIYELTDDTLTICVGSSDDKDLDEKRPTTFADTDKNLAIIFMKKDKKSESDGKSARVHSSSVEEQGGGGKKGGKGVGDRNRVFDILANGRAYFLISDVSPRLGSALWQYLKDKGITNGQVTREIFEAFNDEGSQRSAGEEDIKSEQAIKALGGAVVRNPDAPGRPIIHVDFFGTHVTDAGLKELAGLKSLQTLNLDGTGVTDAGLKELAGLKSLRSLNLCVTKVTDEGLKELSALMGLQSLSLQQTNATDLKGLKGLISLKKLDLWHTKVTDAGLKELKDLHSLQDLSLRGTNVTDAGLKELKDLHSLQGLSLHHTNVTDAGLKELASLQSLHTLDLGFTRVTDAGLKELAGFKNLHTLGLTGTQVTDAGLKELGGLVSLRTLNLHNCKITNAGLRELVGLQSLRGLVLIGTQVTDAGVAELQKALPKCNITRGDPRKVP